MMKEIELKVNYSDNAPLISEQLLGHVAPRAGETLDKYAAAIRLLEDGGIISERTAEKAFDRLTPRIQSAVNRYLARNN